jgi:hypothetical protein
MPIGDCRLPIKKVARQLPPLSIGNQQSKIGNADEEHRQSEVNRLW